MVQIATKIFIHSVCQCRDDGSFASVVAGVLQQIQAVLFVNELGARMASGSTYLLPSQSSLVRIGYHTDWDEVTKVVQGRKCSVVRKHSFARFHVGHDRVLGARLHHASLPIEAEDVNGFESEPIADTGVVSMATRCYVNSDGMRILTARDKSQSEHRRSQNNASSSGC